MVLCLMILPSSASAGLMGRGVLIQEATCAAQPAPHSEKVSIYGNEGTKQVEWEQGSQ